MALSITGWNIHLDTEISQAKLQELPDTSRGGLSVSDLMKKEVSERREYRDDFRPANLKTYCAISKG